MSDGDIVLDFLTNLCGLSLSAALPKVKGFLAAGVHTRAALFALTDGELKDKCGITHAAQRKKVCAAHVRAVPWRGAGVGGVLVSGGARCMLLRGCKLMARRAVRL